MSPKAPEKRLAGSLRPSDGDRLLAVIGRYLEAERAAREAEAELLQARDEVVEAFMRAGLPTFHYGPWV